MAETLAPAIRLAEEGFPVAPLTAYYWRKAAERLAHASSGIGEMLLDGRAPAAAEVFHNRRMARTFRKIAEGGSREFYEGEIARAIVGQIQAAGGVMTREDLANHKSECVEPISTTYRGLRVWECPPNGQGLTALLTLNLLEWFDLAHLPPLGAQRLHLIIEALRLAFADAFRHISDPALSQMPLEALLSKEYAERRRVLIDHTRAAIDPPPGIPGTASDTVCLSVIDGQGNACSFINSLYMGFGSGIVPQGWGFCLHNRGLNFRLDPNHPNALAPGKRPYHTIIPAMATRRDGSLYASFGVMGGFMQPQGHTQVFVALADDGLGPQAELDRPRICLQGEYELTRGVVAIEQGIPERTMEVLENMGHSVELVRDYERAIFGRGQIILRNPQSGATPRQPSLAKRETVRRLEP